MPGCRMSAELRADGIGSAAPTVSFSFSAWAAQAASQWEWELQSTAAWQPLTVTLTITARIGAYGAQGTSDDSENPFQGAIAGMAVTFGKGAERAASHKVLNLLVADAAGKTLMRLDGGLFDKAFKKTGLRTVPMETTVVDSSGAMVNTVCNISKKKLDTWSWSCGAFDSKDVTVELTSPVEKGVWAMKDGTSITDTALPSTITTCKAAGGRMRAWSGQAPKSAAESETAAAAGRLLGYVPTDFKMTEQKGATCVRTATMAVHPDLLRKASEADLANLLGILTDKLWSLGLGNRFGAVVDSSMILGAAGGARA